MPRRYFRRRFKTVRNPWNIRRRRPLKKRLIRRKRLAQHHFRVQTNVAILPLAATGGAIGLSINLGALPVQPGQLKDIYSHIKVRKVKYSLRPMGNVQDQPFTATESEPLIFSAPMYALPTSISTADVQQNSLGRSHTPRNTISRTVYGKSVIRGLNVAAPLQDYNILKSAGWLDMKANSNAQLNNLTFGYLGLAWDSYTPIVAGTVYKYNVASTVFYSCKKQ